MSARASEASERTIAPLGLLAARGHWFVAALSGEDLKVFRVDRMEAAELTDQPFERPEGRAVEELIENGRVFIGRPDQQVAIRYSPRIAPWIAEREGRGPAPDGSVTVEYPLGDAEWAVGHVLQYGPEAEVVSPPVVRDLVRERLEEILRDG